MTGQPSTLPREGAEDEARSLQAHIDRRVAQIMKLAQSLPQHSNVPKTSMQYDWVSSSYAVRPDPQTQLQRTTTSRAGVTKENLIEALQASIDALHGADHRYERLALSARSQQERETFEAIRRAIRELLQTRRSQIRELTASSGGGGRSVDSRTALQVELQLEQDVRQLRFDFNELHRLQTELDRAREGLEVARLRLRMLRPAPAGPSSAP